MNPLNIVSAPTSAAPPSGDPSSGGSDSGSDFGPILQAASASPAASSRAAGDAASGGSKPDAGAGNAPPSDQTAAEPERTVGRRTGRGNKAEPLPGLDTLAAACAAAASNVPAQASAGTLPALEAPRAQGAADSIEAAAKPASQLDPVGAGAAVTGEPTDTDKAAITALRAAVIRASDQPTSGQTAPLQTEDSALAAVRAHAQATVAAPAALAVAVDARAPLLGAGAPREGQGAADDAARALNPSQQESGSSQDQSTDAGPDQGMPWGFGSTSTVGRSGGDNAPAAVRMLSSETLLPASDPVRLAPSQAAPAHTPGLAVDASSAGVTSPGTAFGNVTSYAPEARATVTTPVGQPGFTQELSERVLVLTRGGAHSAQISLEPAGLGPVGVAIQVRGHEATLVFTAQHAATRDALEAALPRLREMFAASGMQLSDASVGGRAQPQWSGSGHASSGGSETAGDDAIPVAASAAEGATPRTAASRLVDIYA